jgi:hypothetical protein
MLADLIIMDRDQRAWFEKKQASCTNVTHHCPHLPYFASFYSYLRPFCNLISCILFICSLWLTKLTMLRATIFVVCIATSAHVLTFFLVNLVEKQIPAWTHKMCRAMATRSISCPRPDAEGGSDALTWEGFFFFHFVAWEWSTWLAYIACWSSKHYTH